MNNNESRTLWLSLGAGLFAAFLLYSYSQEKKAEYDRQYGASKTVVIAHVDISEMSTVEDSMLEVVQRPTDFVEPSSIQDPEVAVGQIAAVPIKKGEQILETKLLHPGPDTGIALQVAPEKRAVSVPVDDARAVSKLIRPGDRVDIYAAVDVGKGSTAHREVTLIMWDVVILATGVNVVNNIPRTIEADSTGKNAIQTNLTGDTKYGTLTIEATPKEAQDLIYLMATSPGNIFFTLRNPNEKKPVPRMPSSNADSFMARFGIGDPTIPNLPRPPVVQVPAQLPVQPAAPQPIQRR
jgi:pilus assembly protein CpaB